jgi:catechol 2,3-dioxygenase-like lactoylglutathione lyase family enzyme
MILGLDEIAVLALTGALDEAVRAYATLLGRTPVHTTQQGARFRLGNMSLVIEAVPSTELGQASSLGRIAFAVGELARAERVLGRRAVPCERSPDGILIPAAAASGVAIRLQVPTAADGASAKADPAAVAGLDHVVIRTPNPERAVAFYGGRLGLDLRLDRTNPAWGARLLFFVCGDLVVELAHDLRTGVGYGPDQLWGLSWRAADIERLHARLTAAGVALSKIRAGRRPGTRVFTVKSHSAGVPTLVIGGEGLARG